MNNSVAQMGALNMIRTCFLLHEYFGGGKKILLVEEDPVGGKKILLVK